MDEYHRGPERPEVHGPEQQLDGLIEGWCIGCQEERLLERGDLLADQLEFQPHNRKYRLLCGMCARCRNREAR